MVSLKSGHGAFNLMAYLVGTAFDQFYSAINLAGDYREIANKRRDHLISLIKGKLDVLEGFPTGSIPRYTALKSGDLDIMVALNYSKHIEGKSPVEVLQLMRDALAGYNRYVRKNGQAVTLYYESWPKVDVVPVSRAVDHNGNIVCYKVPNTHTGNWVESDPPRHTREVLASASAYGENFRKVIKMIKFWSRAHGDYLQSYHIEVMALKTFTSSMADLPWEVFKFFEGCHNLLQGYLWHQQSLADDYLSYNDRDEIKKRLADVTAKARNAWYEIYANKNHEKAIKLWKQIFGDSFPAYG